MQTQSRLLRLKELENAELRIGKLITKLQETDRRFSYCRLSAFLAGLGGSLILYLVGLAFPAALTFLLGMGMLLFLSDRHGKILRKLKLCKIVLWVKQRNIARLNLKWEDIKSFRTAEYKPGFLENDLNLMGEESLHLLLDTAVSMEGSSILRKWLMDPELSIEKISQRQALIKELMPQVKFRENLVVSALLSGKPNEGAKLLSWLETGGIRNEKKLKDIAIFLSFLAPVNILFIVLNILNILPAYLWVISSLLYLSVYYMNQKDVEDLPDEADTLKKEFGRLSRIFGTIEKNRFSKSPGLKELCEPFFRKGEGPSLAMKRINRIVTLQTFKANPVFWFLMMMITPLDYLAAYELIRLKKRIGDYMPEWLDVWHKLEALSSLANFAYLNPEYSFPRFITEEGSKNYFNAEQMGHPLIPEDKKVRNDFHIGPENRISLITGSNMSGKSTFLRTLGINSALALAGAPVDARHMEIKLVRLFTCIKVSDSVTDGISYFYAEVKRLKTLLVLLESKSNIPVLFFIDEIFKGTNNVERLIGSRSFIRALVGKNGFGLVTTHDLELTKIADEIPSAENFHFREQVSGNLMKFDYLLRQGPCPTTNALKIMEIEGLPVDKNYL